MVAICKSFALILTEPKDKYFVLAQPKDNPQAQPIRKVTPLFHYGYHRHLVHNAGSPDTAKNTTRFVIKFVPNVAKIQNWSRDPMQTIPIAILPSKSPEKLVSV